MLYLITNRKLIQSGNLYSVIEGAILGGVDRVILREKDLNYNDLLLVAAILKPILDSYQVPLIINGNLEVGRSLNTAGFHIGYSHLSDSSYTFKGMLGISVHSLQEAIEAEKLGANYLLASHIFETQCKEGIKPKGLKLIESIKAHVGIPVIALGGINHTNTKEVITSGADGIAVMSYIMASKNPFKNAKTLKDILL